MKPRATTAAKPMRTARRLNDVAPVTGFATSKLLVIASLLHRGAIIRYRRLVGLSSVEFGIVAILGRRPPVSVAGICELIGMDKGQISRALANLARRRLIARTRNPSDAREVLVSLSTAGLAAHDRIVASSRERNTRLLDQLTADEIAVLFDLLERLTAAARDMLADELRADEIQT
jgi:DNA-binding MarR family transcriptional regulator